MACTWASISGAKPSLVPRPNNIFKKVFFHGKSVLTDERQVMMFDVVVGIGDVIDKVQTSLESEMVRSTAAASEDLNL